MLQVHRTSPFGVWNFIGLAGMMLTLTTFVQADNPPRSDLNEPRILNAINDTLGLAQSNIQALTISKLEPGRVQSTIRVGNEIWILDLKRHSIRSDEFKIFVPSEPGGLLVAVEPPPVATYRGMVVQRPGSRVSATVWNGQIRAIILTDEGLIAVQPIDQLGIWAPTDQHVVYRASDWIRGGQFSCGTDASLRFALEEPENVSGGIAGTGFKVVDLAIDADVEFFQKNGSSIANTVRDIEGVLDAVEFVYERDVDISYEITTIVVRTGEPDPYEATDPVALLCELRTTWNNTPESSIRRDTTHLFTGKNVDSNVVGIAFVGVICNAQSLFQGCSGGRNSVAYGLSESRFTTNFNTRVGLTAHELGHNWGANHCNGGSCHIMCAGLGGCGGIGGLNLKFGSTSISSIVSHRNSRSCLNNLSSPVQIPFRDDFPTAILDQSKWTFNQGAQVTSSAIDIPSPSFTLELDASGGADYLDDDLRSNFIQLGGLFNTGVSFATQHRGVPLGGALDVDYWNNNLAWKSLTRIESDGVDQSSFVDFFGNLPADAFHDEFRLRFRSDVAGSAEDWFIDDVRIESSCFVDSECLDAHFCDGEEQCVYGQCVSGEAPCAAEGACDELLDLCFDPTCPPPTVVATSSRYLVVELAAAAGPVGLVVAPQCDPTQFNYAMAPNVNGAVIVSSSAAQEAFLAVAEWGAIVEVTGLSVVPETDYYLFTDCGSPGEPRLSARATGTTQRWGDVVGMFTGSIWTPPDGDTDIVDATAILDRFRGAPTAPEIYRADQVSFSSPPCIPDQSIDIVDVVASLDGFKSLTYFQSFGCFVPCP